MIIWILLILGLFGFIIDIYEGKKGWLRLAWKNFRSFIILYNFIVILLLYSYLVSLLERDHGIFSMIGEVQAKILFSMPVLTLTGIILYIIFSGYMKEAQEG